MHRTFTIQIPADKTEEIVSDLLKRKEVIGLSTNVGSSQKPAGDVLVVQLLNRGADEVLTIVSKRCGESPYLITTALTESMIEADQAEKLEDDVDEAIWEEIETTMRHQGRLSINFISLMALGGIMATVGILAESTAQTMPFVAAAVIAPGFEPIAGMSLGLVLRRWQLLGKDAIASVVGYAVLIAASALTFWLMQATGNTSIKDFVDSEEVKHMAHSGLGDWLLSIAGALAGGLIISSFRKSVIAGALIAMVLIHAAAVVGVGLACGRFDLAGTGLLRFGIDVALILVGCSVVFWIKQRFFHQRRPIE
jgi:hypothetical protein